MFRRPPAVFRPSRVIKMHVYIVSLYVVGLEQQLRHQYRRFLVLVADDSRLLVPIPFFISLCFSLYAFSTPVSLRWCSLHRHYLPRFVLTRIIGVETFHTRHSRLL